MSRYLLGSLLGGLALMAMFGAGVTDWLTNQASGNTAGVRVAQQSSNASSPGSVEKAGRLIQRQSEPVSAADQSAASQNGIAAGQSTSNTVSNPNTPSTNTPQGQPGTSSNPTNTGVGTTPGTTGSPTAAPAAQGTPAPANLESIPALW